MPQCQFVMVLIIENVEKISIERVNILNLGEMLKRISKFLGDGVLAKFNFSHIERSNSGNSIAGMNNGWCFSLSPRKNNVNQISSWRDSLNILKIVAHLSMLKL